MNKLSKPAHKIHFHILNSGASGISMRLRLFVFLTVFVLAMLMFFFMVLILSGDFSYDIKKLEDFCSSELDDIAAEIEKEYGGISASAVMLSASLAQSMEQFLSEKGLTTDMLDESPTMLEELLDREFERLLFSMEKTGVSGAFIVLDTTVNNLAGNSEFSRAGLYLKNMEPNIVSSTSPTITVFRGFPNIARKRGYSLHAQWDMEFTINRPPYFFMPFENIKKTGLPLSRLYHWSSAEAIYNTSEDVMICAVPIIDSNGQMFGVCGYEMSAMLFKLKFTPDNSAYRRIFCMLSAAEDSLLHTENALFSGSYNSFSIADDNEPLKIRDRHGLLFSYSQTDGTHLDGLHKDIRLYPNDSAFADDRFAVSLFIPREDTDRIRYLMKIRLALLSLLFLSAGVIISIFISKKYTSPIAAGLSAIGSQNIDGIDKTNIREIDEIIEQIKAAHIGKSTLPDNLFEDFIEKVKLLTPAEKTIFRYYVEGKTNSEILSLLYISLSTFKTHNSHIYSKLGISSRDELLLYIKLIQKSGYISKIE